MTPEPRRPRREGWPWPAPQACSDHETLTAAQNLVNVAALAVADLTEALRLALQRLEAAEVEARTATESIAAREANDVIAHARRHDA